MIGYLDLSKHNKQKKSDFRVSAQHYDSSDHVELMAFVNVYFFFLDENECKYRPCDVFAQCTNTLGSFTCTCYPGYEGDGFTCTGKPLIPNVSKRLCR